MPNETKLTPSSRLRVSTQRISLAADVLESVACAAERCCQGKILTSYQIALQDFARAARALKRFHA